MVKGSRAMAMTWPTMPTRARRRWPRRPISHPVLMREATCIVEKSPRMTPIAARLAPMESR